MVEITLQVSEEVANKSTRWLPTILELNMVTFQTPAATIANEIIRYLLEGPLPAELLKHTPSAAAQAHLARLLALNRADRLNATEQRELDELEQIEHIMRMAKLGIIQQEN